MLGELHDILHEFPEYKKTIEDLRQTDTEFASLMDSHDDLDAKIRDLEEHDQPVADGYMEDLKKQRIVLKDKIYEIVKGV